MKISPCFWYLLVTITIIVASFVACGNPPLVQPENIVSVTQIATKTTKESVTPGPPTTSTVEQNVVPPTQQAVSETSTKPLPTSTSVSAQTTVSVETNPSSEEKIQPEIIKPTEGVLKLDLKFPDDVSTLATPVSKIIYTSSELPDGTSTTIWIADTEDVTHKTKAATFSHPPGIPIVEAVLSPDNNWIAYAEYESNDNPFWVTLKVMRLETQDQLSLDPNLFRRLRGGKTILWSPDSSSLAYVTIFGEIYLIQIDNNQKQLLTQLDNTRQAVPSISDNRDIALIGWPSEKRILYITKGGEPKWRIKSINIETDDEEELSVFDGWALDDASLSPDKYKILLSADTGCSLIANKPEDQAGQIFATNFFCSLRPVWIPDSQGIVVITG